MNGKNLGEIIKERRKAKGLTQVELSTLSEVSGAYIGRSERGERFPSGMILRKLAGPLGFTTIELLKVVGILSPDEIDERRVELKAELKREIALSLGRFYHIIDSF